MLIKLATGKVYYDLSGPENGQVVCFTHSLASDGGMWAEQLPPLLAAGYRVLRLDMRGHGGSDPSRATTRWNSWRTTSPARSISSAYRGCSSSASSIGGMLGQAFAIKYGQRLISAMLCDTLPQTPPGAQTAWAPRIEAVKKRIPFAPLADPTMERWFTDAYKPRNSGRWKQIPCHDRGTTPAGYLGCAAASLTSTSRPSCHR
jgi:3-oxoadipate enol-lactonase